jgi:hypothetical protein
LRDNREDFAQDGRERLRLRPRIRRIEKTRLAELEGRSWDLVGSGDEIAAEAFNAESGRAAALKETNALEDAIDALIADRQAGRNGATFH